MPDKFVDAFMETVKGGEETIKACEKLLSLSYEELAEEIERMRKEQDAQVGRKGESDEHWQKITEGVKIRYAKVGEGKAGSKTQKSGGRAKKGVQRKSVSRGDSSGA